MKKKSKNNVVISLDDDFEPETINVTDYETLYPAITTTLTDYDKIVNLDDEDETVEHPDHYNSGKYETIDVIIDQGFGEGFCLGNVLKYVTRAQHKGKYLEDLKKAQFYLDIWIEYKENE